MKQFFATFTQNCISGEHFSWGFTCNDLWKTYQGLSGTCFTRGIYRCRSFWLSQLSSKSCRENSWKAYIATAVFPALCFARIFHMLCLMGLHYWTSCGRKYFACDIHDNSQKRKIGRPQNTVNVSQKVELNWVIKTLVENSGNLTPGRPHQKEVTFYSLWTCNQMMFMLPWRFRHKCKCSSKRSIWTVRCSLQSVASILDCERNDKSLLKSFEIFIQSLRQCLTYTPCFGNSWHECHVSYVLSFDGLAATMDSLLQNFLPSRFYGCPIWQPMTWTITSDRELLRRLDAWQTYGLEYLSVKKRQGRTIEPILGFFWIDSKSLL